MRISRIEFNDFRIYKGANIIRFSKTNSDKNITVIAGQNGFGKTTFLTGVVWGFYGKLISEVDDKYKREVYEIGGYKKYAHSLLNRGVLLSDLEDKSVSVEIELSDISIPSVPCSKISIRRTYNVASDYESTKILIDGLENELTNEVGPDIFINDFILPREIAKFFLFDAEKIVDLAEVRTITQRRRLSKAFSEVLGISKYEKLIRNLENLRIKLRRRAADSSDREKLVVLQKKAEQIEQLIALSEEKIAALSNEIQSNRILSEQYQEKLIREGNSMTLEELIQQKGIRDSLKQRNKEIKLKIKDFLDLAPFVIAGKELLSLKEQINKEEKYWGSSSLASELKSVLEDSKKKIEVELKNKKFNLEIRKEILEIITRAFSTQKDKNESFKVLTGLSEEQTNEFHALINNILRSYNEQFKLIVKEERDNRIALSRTSRRIAKAETRDRDLLSKRFKEEKKKVDKTVTKCIDDQRILYGELGALQQEYSTLAKQVSELSKKVKLNDDDINKDRVAERLIGELSEFILKFKSHRKTSLQNRIMIELRQLMHKEGYITKVIVDLEDEYIDIKLFNNDSVIEKETLSKGEQQLYATALLKALVDESGVKFPILIDSPLQKFDRNHSKNIITEFYPAIAQQVILFPLLEKELSNAEYSMLSPYVNQTVLIQNSNEGSKYLECHPEDLFNEFEMENNVQ